MTRILAALPLLLLPGVALAQDYAQKPAMTPWSAPASGVPSAPMFTQQNPGLVTVTNPSSGGGGSSAPSGTAGTAATGTGAASPVYDATTGKGLLTAGTALPAGTNTLGAVNQGAVATTAANAWAMFLALGGTAVSASNPVPTYLTYNGAVASNGNPVGVNIINQAVVQPYAMYNSTPPAVGSGSYNPLQLDQNGELRATLNPGAVAITGCGGSTSATAGTPTTLVAAGLTTHHLMLQNNGTAATLFSFTQPTATLTTTTAYTLAAGQAWTNPDTMPMGTIVRVQSATASMPIACEYQ